MNVESAKGECNLGQHEIGFRYDDVMITADNHAVYKTMAKEIAAQHGRAITFMAKFDEREGNSCHVHLSLRGADGSLVFGDERSSGPRSTTTSSPACSRRWPTSPCSTRRTSTRTSGSLTASFAPTTIAWGTDNRTCAVRLVGAGPSARLENRVPGGDVNPYLVLAAMIAGGLHGIRAELPLEPELVGNAYTSGRPRVPRTLRAARDAFCDSAVARDGVRRRGRRPLHPRWPTPS